jgi:endonuclease YncB( thermonuclease family)
MFILSQKKGLSMLERLLSHYAVPLPLVAAIWLLAFPFSLSSQAEQICSVHDGDTIKLCTGQSVRFHGIDAPELHQPMGYESRDFLMSYLKGKNVDFNCKGKSFKRQICRVWANGRDVEEEMVSQGWAFDYPKYSKGQYAQAQTSAQTHQLGVWQLPDGGQRPWDWRYERRNHNAKVGI